MLERIEVKNLALLESAVLEPGPHFTVLTGETGAGKSLLLGAVEALTGARMYRDQIRTGCAKAQVDAIFSGKLPLDPQLQVDLGLISEDPLGEDSESKANDSGQAQQDFSDQEPPVASELGDEECILSRELGLEGKSRCRINGRLIPLSQLRQVGENLIAIHGQRASQKIFEIPEQVNLLFRYALLDPQARSEYAPYLSARQEWLEAKKAMGALGMSEGERQNLLDLLRYQLQEIEAVNPVIGEEEALRKRQKKFRLGLELGTALQDSLRALEGDLDLPGALGLLSQSQQALNRLQTYGDRVRETAEAVAKSEELATQAADQLRRLLEHLDFSQEELEAIEGRLDRLARLQKKYGGSLERVCAYRERARAKEVQLLDLEDSLQAAQQRLEAAAKRLEEAGERWGKCFQLRGEALAEAINAELQSLGMKQACFSLSWQTRPLDQADQYGLKSSEFLLTSNVGEEAKPLAKIASGGEAARILLAIKGILAEVDEIPVLVFDEIDAGVSGETSALVGEKLMKLAQRAQVICVTHSAYLASMADKHYRITKEVENGRTRTRLEVLNPEGTRAEIARLLSGDTDRETAERLAQSLLERAAQMRKEGI